MGLEFPRILFYVTTTLRIKILKSHFWDESCTISFATSALPSLNYEEPMTKDDGTQTNNTIFQLLEHDYSIYHTDYSKSIIILELKIQECSTDPRVKKRNMLFKHHRSRIKK